MKVKVGDRWYTSDDAPIMVQLTAKDRESIAAMPADNNRFAVFQMGSMTQQEMLDWMDEGYVKDDV